METAYQYDVDFYSWTQEQAALLRAMPGGTCPLDLDNLVEEIEDMGRNEIREISSLLHQTLAHLLKIAICPSDPSVDHWFNESLTFQGDAVIVFSPGLRQRLVLETIWRVACNGATRSLGRFGVAVPALPEICPLSLDDLLQVDFDPDHAVAVISAAIKNTPSRQHGHR